MESTHIENYENNLPLEHCNHIKKEVDHTNSTSIAQATSSASTKPFSGFTDVKLQISETEATDTLSPLHSQTANGRLSEPSRDSRVISGYINNHFDFLQDMTDDHRQSDLSDSIEVDLSTNTQLESSSETQRLESPVMRDKSSISRSEGRHDDDNDTGVYDMSVRSSVWVFENDSESDTDPEDITTISAEGLPDDSTLPEGEPVSEISRSDSTSTMTSDNTFQKSYRDIEVKVIARQGSRSKFMRDKSRMIEPDKIVKLQRSTGDEGLGFHVLGDFPTHVSTVIPESQAERKGIKVGDVIVGVQYERVLHKTHKEIVDLLKSGVDTLHIELCRENSFASMRQESVVEDFDCSGYLYKLSTHNIWQKRWFELKSDRCLYYYKKEKDPDVRGAVPLQSGYSMQKAVDLRFKKREFSLKLVPPSSNLQTYYLAAENLEDYNRWAQSINKATLTETGNYVEDPGWIDVGCHNVQLPALSIKRMDCSGHLWKQGGSNKTWNKRYSVLKHGCLYYYKNMDSGHAQGIAHLHGYTVVVGNTTSKRFSFDLIPPENDLRTFHFYSESEMERSKWVKAMKKSISCWVRVE